MKHGLRSLLLRQAGMATVEYALLAGLVASAVIAVMGLREGGFSALFDLLSR
jgi:Flp pilus assembly pilin Flp